MYLIAGTMPLLEKMTFKQACKYSVDIIWALIREKKVEIEDDDL